jgi:uncharacterized protein YggE
LQLQKLGADKATLVATESTLPGESDESRQMQYMMMQQMRARGRVTKAPQTAKSVTVESTITAEWPLTMKTTDEMLAFVESVQSKVEAADLGGTKQPKKLTPEEEELQAEMAQTMMGYESGQQKPGVPAFAFVARLPAKERGEAQTMAFAKAKAQAQQLAAAAGSKLGKLSSLSGNATPSNDDYNSRNVYAMRMFMSQVAGGQEEEAIVPQPGMATFQVTVSATFRLE